MNKKKLIVHFEEPTETFKKYAKRHKKKLEELEEEATGKNLERPRQTDYSEYLEET